MVTLSLAAYNGRRALITGVTGFKGAWLGRWLQHLGAEVSGLSLPPPTTPSLFQRAELESHLRWIEGDIRDAATTRSALGRCEPDIVFHLAAQSLVRPSYEDPADTFSTNVMGTVQVLDAVRVAKRPVAVVVVTSDKCYENREQDAGYREDDALGGHDPYSASKGAAEIITSSYRRSFFAPDMLAEHGVALASGRAGNVIGPGDWARDRIVPDSINSLREGLPIPVRNPRSIRPWQHVLESLSGYLTLGAALLGAEKAQACTTFNFGPANADTCTVAEVVDRMVKAWGEGSWNDLSHGAAPHEAKILRLDVRKAASVLGWVPTWRIDDAVRHTVEGYKALEGASGATTREIMLQQILAYEASARLPAAGAPSL